MILRKTHITLRYRDKPGFVIIDLVVHSLSKTDSNFLVLDESFRSFIKLITVVTLCSKPWSPVDLNCVLATALLISV